MSYKCFHARHLAEAPAGYPNKNSKNRKIESARGTMMGWYGVGGKAGYSLILTPILSLKVKNQIRPFRNMFPVRDCIYAHHNQTTQKQTKWEKRLIKSDGNRPAAISFNEQWSPAGRRVLFLFMEFLYQWRIVIYRFCFL